MDRKLTIELGLLLLAAKGEEGGSGQVKQYNAKWLKSGITINRKEGRFASKEEVEEEKQQIIYDYLSTIADEAEFSDASMRRSANKMMKIMKDNYEAGVDPDVINEAGKQVDKIAKGINVSVQEKMKTLEKGTDDAKEFLAAFKKAQQEHKVKLDKLKEKLAKGKSNLTNEDADTAKSNQANIVGWAIAGIITAAAIGLGVAAYAYKEGEGMGDTPDERLRTARKRDAIKGLDYVGKDLSSRIDNFSTRNTEQAKAIQKRQKEQYAKKEQHKIDKLQRKIQGEYTREDKLEDNLQQMYEDNLQQTYQDINNYLNKLRFSPNVEMAEFANNFDKFTASIEKNR